MEFLSLAGGGVHREKWRESSSIDSHPEPSHELFVELTGKLEF
jgi:hypothetical protein